MLFDNNNIITLYKNEYGYYTRIAKKDLKDDNWYNHFIRVSLSDEVKAMNLPNKCKIQLVNSFLTFNHNKVTNEDYFYIYIKRCNLIEDLTIDKN